MNPVAPWTPAWRLPGALACLAVVALTCPALTAQSTSPLSRVPSLQRSTPVLVTPSGSSVSWAASGAALRVRASNGNIARLHGLGARALRILNPPGVVNQSSVVSSILTSSHTSSGPADAAVVIPQRRPASRRAAEARAASDDSERTWSSPIWYVPESAQSGRAGENRRGETWRSERPFARCHSALRTSKAQ